MRVSVLIVFILLCQLTQAQKSGFNLLLGGGPSYFFNEKSMVNHCRLLGANYIYYPKSKIMGFGIGLVFQSNAYRTRIVDSRFMHVKQRMHILTTDVYLKLKGRSYMHVGLFAGGVHDHSIFIGDKYYNGHYYHGSSELDKGYASANVQAGVTLGCSFPLFKKRDHRIGIKAMHFASPLVNHDYYPNKLLVGQEVRALSVTARPTMLIAELSIAIRKKEQKKEKEEE